MVSRFSSAERTAFVHTRIRASAHAAARTREARESFARSVQGINRQAAEQLGIKIGGFLRQNFPSKSNVAYLLDAHGIHQENSIGATAGLLDGFPGIT